MSSFGGEIVFVDIADESLDPPMSTSKFEDLLVRTYGSAQAMGSKVDVVSLLRICVAD